LPAQRSLRFLATHDVIPPLVKASLFLFSPCDTFLELQIPFPYDRDCLRPIRHCLVETFPRARVRSIRRRKPQVRQTRFLPYLSQSRMPLRDGLTFSSDECLGPLPFFAPLISHCVVLQPHSFGFFETAEAALGGWERVYNEVRFSMALGGRTPAEKLAAVLAAA